MNCHLCKQYVPLFSFHDVGKKILEYYGSPHISCGDGGDDMKAYSRYVNISIIKREEEILVDVSFMCTDDNIVKSVHICNYIEISIRDSTNNNIILNNIVNIIKNLNLKIYFEGKRHIRPGEIYDINQDEVLIYDKYYDKKLESINVSVY